MSASFASGIYAIMAEEFDEREKRELTEQLQELLESMNFAHVAVRYESELSLAGSMLYCLLSLRSSPGKLVYQVGLISTALTRFPMFLICGPLHCVALHCCASDWALRTPGQDYCGLSLVSPALSPSSPTLATSTAAASAYAAVTPSDYLLLCGALSLARYLSAPRHQTVLSRALLPLLPRALTASSGLGSSLGGLMQALGEMHRMCLLVDGG